MERNVKLLIAYDGTEFHGWQHQPDLRTVQGEIEHCLIRIVRHPVSVRGSGRTDAGVHARGQVANFRTTCTIPARNIGRAINSRLPDDVAILDVRDVHPDFVASASATSKLYRYTIHNDRRRPVRHHMQRYAYHCWRRLDTERLLAAARHFIGEMDFSAMASSGCVRETMVRRVLRCDVRRRLESILIDVEGTGFLYNQVRNMVGTLIEIGRGHWPVEKLPEILASRKRSEAGPTAPARGLCLQWVRYPPELLVAPSPPPEPTGTAS